ncbi:hypothetical protein EVAR_56964_1 [Eumeta japonica]|uniref:Uncharacterized protein n=1 Tax=Eumeta variegata TaxID=151549 RepID=A0A4C1YM56_EUMVA|nr:hypothetical protein EVAR_56964_1 [Eumeta japonica]
MGGAEGRRELPASTLLSNPMFDLGPSPFRASESEALTEKLPGEGHFETARIKRLVFAYVQALALSCMRASRGMLIKLTYTCVDIHTFPYVTRVRLLPYS